MKVQKYSKNSIFLFEIIVNLLLFSFLVTIGLSFFIKTHSITEKTCRLHHSVTWCSNIASLYEVGDGSLDNLSEQFAYAVSMNDKLVLYLDEEFNETNDSHYSYYVMISLLSDSKNTNLTKAKITFYTKDAEEIYKITACNYKKITPSMILKEVSP